MVTYSRLGGTSSSPALQGCRHADVRVGGIGEALSLHVAPQFVCRPGSLGPVLCPRFPVLGAELQNTLWGLWAYLTRAVDCV